MMGWSYDVVPNTTKQLTLKNERGNQVEYDQASDGEIYGAAKMVVTMMKVTADGYILVMII